MLPCYYSLTCPGYTSILPSLREGSCVTHLPLLTDKIYLAVELTVISAYSGTTKRLFHDFIRRRWHHVAVLALLMLEGIL